MNLHQWADCIGMLATEGPIASELRAAGVPESAAAPATIELPDGASIHFRDGRLCAVALFAPVEPLPAGLSWEDPLPSGFRETKPAKPMSPGVATAEIGDLRVEFLTDHGMRFSLTVEARGDLEALGDKPFSRALADNPWATAPQPAAAPPISGIEIGYKSSWFAVRSDDVEGIATSLMLRGTHTPCPADRGAQERVPFISAAREGWRLVLWASDNVESGLLDARAMSRKLGTDVGFFASDRVIDSYAWSRFSNGDPSRIFWTEDGTVHKDEGERHSSEPASVDEEAVRNVARAMTTPAVVLRAPGSRIE